MRKLLRIIPGLVLAPWLASCASVQATSKPDALPALSVPPAPPRVIEIAPEPLPEPVADLPSPPGTTATRARRDAPKPATTETKPAATDKPVEPPPADTTSVPPAKPPETAAPAAPVPQLRTTQTADTSNAARTVRATLDRAYGLLSSVNFGTLSNERKKAYNDAKHMMQQAEDALGKSNFDFAQGLATKAETLARELAGEIARRQLGLKIGHTDELQAKTHHLAPALTKAHNI